MDQKGRFRLPSAFIGIEAEGADELALQVTDPRPSQEASQTTSNFVVTNSLYKGEKCLDLYPEHEWKKIERKMSELPAFDAHVQAFQRFYISSAQHLQKDGQDRLLIPTQLREFAGLDSQIVAIGMGHKVELWNETSWQKIFADIAINYDDILKAVSHFQQEKK